MLTMGTESPVSRDVQLPGQEVESADLDPTIDPEPARDSEKPDEPAASETAASQPEAADNPELGNTLIRPDSS
jgi:hypothetical protein